MNALLKRLKELWLARNPRERRALSIMGAVVLAAVVIQLVWDASHERAGLRQQLSLRRMELAIMQRQTEALSAPAAATRPATTLSGNALDAAWRAELPALEGVLTLRVSGPRQVELKGEAGFDALNSWLAVAHKNHGLRVTSAEIRTADTGAGGRVSVNLELAGE